MKLRIKGNSIRLRITQGEAQKLASGETIKEALHFPEVSWSYSLGVSQSSYLSAHLRPNQLAIVAPESQLRAWAQSDRVTLDCPQRDPANEPTILVEKDFACLTPRPGDDDADTFPHPAADKQHC